jgi:hypothetical protein
MAIGFMSFGGMLTGGDSAEPETKKIQTAEDNNVQDKQVSTLVVESSNITEQ